MTKYKDGKISCKLCNYTMREREVITWFDGSFINPIDDVAFICEVCDDNHTHEEIKEKIKLYREI